MCKPNNYIAKQPYCVTSEERLFHIIPYISVLDAELGRFGVVDRQVGAEEQVVRAMSAQRSSTSPIGPCTREFSK